ncbi:50S ribosomal protein L18 [Candidatus Roizmanbacteria bacterium]|nr:50S ribosomal protein L18 [Candidatus Roizmanbacteria bacterium]
MDLTQTNRKIRRKKRISKKIIGTKERPRVSVFVSNRYTYAQIIDDEAKKTLVSFSSLILSRSKNYKKAKKLEEAKKIGIELAKVAQGKKITKAVFDRAIYSYNGRVKALAEGLRQGGLKI